MSWGFWDYVKVCIVSGLALSLYVVLSLLPELIR